MKIGVYFISTALLFLAEAEKREAPGVCRLLDSGQDVEAVGGVVPWEGKNAGKYYSVSSGNGDINKCSYQCCKRENCHVAFLYGGENCYLISCVSRNSCKPKPSKSSKHVDSRFVWVREPDLESLSLSPTDAPTPTSLSSSVNSESNSPIPLEDHLPQRDEAENPQNLNQEVASATENENIAITTEKRGGQLGFGQTCGDDVEGLCADNLVCKSEKNLLQCMCRDGSAWDNSKGECIVIVPEAPRAKQWEPKGCTTGMRDCDVNEICEVMPEREKSKRGVCRCMKGLNRDEESGRCIQISGQETKGPTVPKKKAISITVSGDHEITLPQDLVELEAVINDNVTDTWSYSWSVVESPKDEDGTEANPYSSKWTGRKLRLQKFSPGNYKLKVEVTGVEHVGVANFLLTVHPEPKPNVPPVAVIDPAAIQADEGTKIILDGSQSHDPDGADDIVTYKWALEKGPALGDIFEPANSPTYQFNTGLPAGNYTFSLTVSDAAGMSDKATVAVAVSKERDDPPRAVAGNCDPQTASGDFSVTLKADRSDNFFHVCGNRSQDDKGIVKYLWNRVGKTDLPADTAGSNTPVLKVTNIEPGSYEFSLKVEDTKGQSDEVTLTVHVAPNKNEPPVARAKLANDKPLVLTRPDEKLSAVLDGSSSSDDGSITAYKWTQARGPAESKIANADKSQATASGLIEGVYTFQLNVTDDQGVSSSAALTFNVTRSSNKAPVALAENVRVALPNSEAVLDGSESTDDAGVVSYEWKLADSSPALLTILGDSDKEAQLRLGNLLPGKFNFTLTVSDAAGLKSSTLVCLEVTASNEEEQSVEMYLEGGMDDFSKRATNRLQNSLSTLLRTRWENAKAVISEISLDRSSGRVRFVFHVPNEIENESGEKIVRIVDGADVLDHIDRRRDMLQGFNLYSIETLYCRKGACSDHGTCNDFTKECTCNRFWMPNLFAVFIMGRKNSCDWSVFYFLIISLLAVSTILATLWAMFCVGRRWCKKPVRRRKYKLLDDSPNSNHRGIGFKKVKGRNGVQMSSLLVSDSAGSDTEEEVTLYDTGTLKRSASYSRTKASKA